MLVSTTEEFNRVLDMLAKQALIVYDVETNGLRWYRDDHIIGVAVLARPGGNGSSSYQPYYLPFRHRVGRNLPIECLLGLGGLFRRPRYLLGWNVKFDVHFTARECIDVGARLIDAQLAAHLVNENEESFALKRLGVKYLGENADGPERYVNQILSNNKLRKSDMDMLNPRDVAAYAEQDAVLAYTLAKKFGKELVNQDIEHLWPQLNDYLEAIVAIERRGVLIDIDTCAEYLRIAREKQAELHGRMRDIVGYDFNPDSVPQLRRILGTSRTDKKALEECDHPIALLLKESRAWGRAASTYYEAFLELADRYNRIHPNFMLIGTISGRLSCREPNLQALPRGNNIYRVRDLVVAPPGYVLMSWDWNQAELRLLAHYTQERFLLDAFRTDKDIHGEVARELNIPRDLAKRVNFGSVYGVGPLALARELGIPVAQARGFLDKYYKLMPGVRRLYSASQEVAARERKIAMWTGRLRHYDDPDETHKAMSNLIQGGVAEMMRVAITRLHRTIADTGAHQVLQVHDEILFEIPEADAARWATAIKRTMEDFPFIVPIKAEGRIGRSWGKMLPIKFLSPAEPVLPDLSGGQGGGG